MSKRLFTIIVGVLVISVLASAYFGNGIIVHHDACTSHVTRIL